ncbi:Retrotransposon-derived protein PEG10 [Labeo rohita]|uniref:ribonuclease H n=1 Tax=Labeo rohita TaxID=84645 RepID=A0ABQ8L2R4_LABRO|nr:Retrotransposon-derived protein PEG10 [Labeo rohita]
MAAALSHRYYVTGTVIGNIWWRNEKILQSINTFKLMQASDLPVFLCGTETYRCLSSAPRATATGSSAFEGRGLPIACPGHFSPVMDLALCSVVLDLFAPRMNSGLSIRITHLPRPLDYVRADQPSPVLRTTLVSCPNIPCGPENSSFEGLSVLPPNPTPPTKRDSRQGVRGVNGIGSLAYGHCHKRGLCGSLRPPSAGTITGLLSHYISHNPVPGISTSGSGSPRVHFPLLAIYRPPAAQSGWNDRPLKLHYRKGLNPDLQVELACRDEGLTLEQYIDLSIRVDNVMRARKSSRLLTSVPQTTPTSEAVPEPMQIGTTKLSMEERERRLRGNLCLYCSQPGHIRANCPTRPPRPPTSVSCDEFSSNRCEIPVILGSGDVLVEATALIDSGAAGNFIDADFVTANRLPVVSCSSHVTVAALDGRPLGSGKIRHTTNNLTLRSGPCHLETIRFFVISSPHSPIILGYPWLNLHGPTIAWADCTITRWSSRCQEHCLQPKIRSEAPPTIHSTKNVIPTEYQDLLEAFSHLKATQLPPHRLGDCAIDLIPGATPPRGRVFPLSQAKSATMNTYIQEELAKGFIRPSTSPASAGFFFVKKKDGGLRPCIDYRGLNEITVKYRHPLPLVPSALEQLRTAKIFTKLDLRSAYNLIRIRSGDEWKTSFSTTSGHYEYRVMPFGLANSPSFFQAFINEVFRDMLNRWVVGRRNVSSSETILPTSMIVAPVSWDIMTEISEAQTQDPPPADCPDNLANGQVERLNQELARFLRSYCHDHQEDWSRYLFWAEYAQNSLRKPSTHLTPFQCVLGFQPPLLPTFRLDYRLLCGLPVLPLPAVDLTLPVVLRFCPISCRTWIPRLRISH